MTQEGLDNARKTLVKFYKALCEVDGYCEMGAEVKRVEGGVMAALCDDLNTPKAMAQLHRVFKALGQAESAEEKQVLAQVIKSSGAMLGILQDDPQVWLDSLATYTQGGATALSDDDVEA